MKSLKLLFLINIVFITFLGCSNIQYSKKTDFSIAKYNKIAVLDFEGNDKEKGKALAESFVPVLMNAGFSIIERSQLDQLIKEQKLSMTGIVDSADIYKVFKIAGVQAVMGGNFHLQKKQNRYTSTTAGNKQHPKETYTNVTTESFFDSISVRIIDVNTAEILFSASSRVEINEGNVDDFFESVANTLKK